MRPRLFLLLAVSLPWFAASPAARAQDLDRPKIDAKDIDAGLRTDWYGVYLDGKKVGYFSTTRAKSEKHYTESFAMTMKLASFGKKSEMNLTQTLKFESKAPYAMVEGEFQQMSGGTGQKIEIKKNDKGFEAVVRVGKEATPKQIGDLDYTLADAMASEMWLKRDPKQGSEINARDFDMQDLKVEEQKSKLLTSKESLVGGVKIRYFEVETISRKDQIKMITLHDDQGKLLKGSLGGLFELRLETEEQAKNIEYSRDLFLFGLAKIDRPLGPTDKVTELVIEVDGKAAQGLEDGPRQSIVKADEGKSLLKLGKKHGKEAKATKKEIEDGLAETTTYCISHEKVKALAEKAVGDAKTPEEKVKRIVDFVKEYVKPSLSASIPNVHDLMEKKSGDCKSYALLTTTLCRAAGVPSREVSGLLYIGDSGKAFGGHAWNEVVLDGVWIPVDASMRQTEVDATHICFGREGKATKNMLETLGKLSFKLVDVQSSK